MSPTVAVSAAMSISLCSSAIEVDCSYAGKVDMVVGTVVGTVLNGEVYYSHMLDTTALQIRPYQPLMRS